MIALFASCSAETVKTGDFRAGGQALALNFVGARRQIRRREQGAAPLVGD